MLVVAAAVGVASCFGAPVSGERASKGLALGIHYFYLFAGTIFFLFFYSVVNAFPPLIYVLHL